MMMMMKSLVPTLLFLRSSAALYVSYEKAADYQPGDRISLVANKLTSPTALSAIDYPNAALCPGSSSSSSSSPIRTTTNDNDSGWSKAVAALHGDAFYETFEFVVGQDASCVTLCETDVTAARTGGVPLEATIERAFSYNWWLDGLPVVYQFEDDSSVSTQYWGGVPVGRVGAPADNWRYENVTATDAMFVYNHMTIEVFYQKQSNGAYNILRTVMEPFSVQRSSSDSAVCDGPTTYDSVVSVPPQSAAGKVTFSYDIKWTEHKNLSPKRWGVFLSMDNTVPAYVEFMGFFLGSFIFCCLVGALYTWVMRDLSYKPVVDESDVETQEQEEEMQMWPLSTRIFFPPSTAPVLLCIACGTGAHLTATGLAFVVLFRTGIVSQSQGANILTAAVVLYLLLSPVAGYVTARLYTIFHGDAKIALASCLIGAIAYPLVGMVISFFVYDVIPGPETPSYNVMANTGPLILVWIFLIWPLTVAGGHFGVRGGVLQNFPVSTGTQGYQDLNLQEDSESKTEQQEMKRGKWARFIKKYNIVVLLLTGGLLPVLSSFVGYCYIVAGPVLVGSYSLRSYSIASFMLFVMVAGAVATLAYYRQIRVHNYQWWWSSFCAAGSAGVYIFMLSMSWLLFKSESHISGSTMTLYTLWFAYISFGVTLMTGSMGVAGCIWFNRALYTHIMKFRQC